MTLRLLPLGLPRSNMEWTRNPFRLVYIMPGEAFGLALLR